MVGTARSGYDPASFPAERMVAVEMGDSCHCYGCRQKTSRVLERIEGVRHHCYDPEKNQVIVTGTMDPSTVIRRLSKGNKHVRFQLDTPPNHQPPPIQPPCVDCNGYPSQHSPLVHSHGLPEHPPPCTGQHCPPPPPHQHPVHGCFNETPPSSACHCPPPDYPVNIHISDSPPPHFACQWPPPSLHPNALSCRQARNNAPLHVLDNFLHGPGSPLIPPNACPADLLAHLGNIKGLNHVDLIKKTGIKFTFEDGRVTSYHPTSYMELRPSYGHYPAMPPPRYVSPFSDENPNSVCSIM